MISEDIKEMTNEDLATALKSSGVNVGPITATTRLVYERKLARIQQDTPAVEENEEMEEEQDENLPEYEEKSSERLTSAYQRFTSPLASKVSGGNIPPSYLRNSQATSSASATPSTKKKGMSIMVKLFILIVFGLIVWLIYINFESPAVKPLLTSNK